MSFDRQDFLADVSKRAQERQANIMPALRAAQAVAPVMEKLMTGTDWDKFLQYLQSYLDQAVRAKTMAQTRLSGNDVWDSPALLKLKSDILVAEAYIEAFTMAMELPKMLVSGGEIATQTIAKFEESNSEN